MRGSAKYPAQGVPAFPATAEARPTGWLLAGRYRIHTRIGAGGMAEVFHASDELLARDVAVKVFRHHPDAANGAGGPKRQSVELQALAGLSHPNLISLFDGSIGEGDETAYLVMELVHGPSLAARIAEAPLLPDEASEVAQQLADALSYVHSRDMVHRDIKPANILLGVDGVTGDAAVRARLSDFGIVRLLGSERLTSVDFLVGTASYLAPEQARGAEVGPAADVYALGLVLLETLTGVRAYEGSVLDAVTARLERSPEIPEHFPAPWPDLLRAMTAIEPAQRPSAAEVGRILRAGRTAVLPPAGVDGQPTAAGRVAIAEVPGNPVLAGTGAAAVVPTRPTRRSQRVSTRGLLAAATVVLAAAAGIEGVLLTRHSDPAPAPLTAPTVARSSVAPPTSVSPQPVTRSSGAISSQAPAEILAATSGPNRSSAAGTSEAPSVSASTLSLAPATRTVTATATATAPTQSPTTSASPSSSATTATAPTSAPVSTSSSPSVSPSATTTAPPTPAVTSPAVVHG